MQLLYRKMRVLSNLAELGFGVYFNIVNCVACSDVLVEQGAANRSLPGISVDNEVSTRFADWHPTRTDWDWTKADVVVEVRERISCRSRCGAASSLLFKRDYRRYIIRNITTGRE